MSSIHDEMRVWRKHLRNCALENKKTERSKGHMNFGDGDE